MGRYNNHTVFIYIVIISIIIIAMYGCVKTNVYKASFQKNADSLFLKKQPRIFDPRDTTDTARHEITFSPTIIGWELVDVESGL